MTELLERARELAPDLVELRRDLHRHPELSFREHRTARTAAERVEALGWRVRTGVGRTGVVAELGSGAPIVALRADMDALPIREQNEVDYRSTEDGVMHACGHDAHVAMLVGAARLLTPRLGSSADRDSAPGSARFSGTVRLLFQPAEEASDDDNLSGAARMIEDGALDGVERVFGLHIGAHLPAGRVYVREGAFMAGSDRFRVTVHGSAAHAGRPQDGVDAILLASQAVAACHAGVARGLSPFASGVLSIGTIEGGQAENIIADRVELSGTIRYYDDATRDALHERLRAAFAVADALGGHASVDILPNYPPVVNDARATAAIRQAAHALLGEDMLVESEPMMEAEDFGILAGAVAGAFFWLGAALEPPRAHHHPRFDIDERVLPTGSALLAACAMDTLQTEGR